MRHTFNEQFPAFRWEFPGILTDVIGDLQLTPDPVEIKLFSPDLKWLQQAAPRVEEEIKKIPGVVDTFDGLTETGPSINFRVRPADAARFGLSIQDIAAAVNTALLGQTASYVLEGDRIVNIRVLADPESVNRIAALRELPLRAANGAVVRLAQVADVSRRAERSGTGSRRFAAGHHRLRAARRPRSRQRDEGNPGQVEPGQMAAARHG